MKLELKLFHKGAAALLAAGLVILTAGLIMLGKCVGMKDVSQLGEGDIKNGVYVKGKIQRLFYTTSENSENIFPAALYTGDSPTGKDKALYTVVLTDMAYGSGKYICLGLDQYAFPENYQYIFGLADNFMGGDPTIVPDGEFEGIIRINSEYKTAADEFAASALDKYSFVTIDGEVVSELNADMISPCYIEMKDLTVRRYIWLIGLPPMIGGIILAIMGGSPFAKSKTEEDNKEK